MSYSFPIPVAKPFSIHKSPDGYCVCGPHAQNAKDNKEAGTISSVHFIVRNKKLCLIDTGRYQKSYAAVAKLIQDEELELKYIILTHDHYDHTGNAMQIQKEFGGEIIAHALDKALYEDPLSIFSKEIMESHYQTSLYEGWDNIGFTAEQIALMKQTVQEYFNVHVEINRYIDSDQSLYLDDLELKLIHTPGHSPGSLSIFVPETSSVYTGDLTFWINPCRVYPIGNAEDCILSLQKIIDLNPSYCGHGHYQGIENPLPWLKLLLSMHHDFENAILKLLDKERDIVELSKLIFPQDPFDNYFPIAENSVESYLIKLLKEEKVIRIDGEKIMWKTV